MNIVEFPSEVLLVCFGYLRGTDLVKLTQTCKAFNSIIQTDSLWKKSCRREFGLDPATQLKCSFRHFYCKVLIKYGGIIGLWRNSTTCYGGLVHIWFTDDGSIIADEYIARGRVREQMYKKSLFCVKICENGQIHVRWLLDFKGQHTMQLIPSVTAAGSESESTLSNFTVSLKPTEGHQKNDTDNGEEEKTQFFQECRLQGTDPALCSYKWDTLVRYYATQEFERIEKLKCRHLDNVPIQPGFFKGMYGGHGTEIVQLFYDMDNSLGLVRKMSGDPNVPSGEISICFDMKKHMTLTRDQQISISDLDKISDKPSNEMYSQYDPKKTCTQPFVCSRGASMHGEDDDSIAPARCIARFHALGTVSPMGYTSPTNITTHFIVFNENLFGVIWLDLYSFSVFSRVDEMFPALR